MATIHRSFPIAAPAAQVWSRVKDLAAVREMFDFLADVDVRGDVRRCNLKDGGALVELIVSVDEPARRVVYSITESPFGLTFHCASWQVVSDGDGVRLDWYTDVKPDAAAAGIGAMIDSQAGTFTAALAAAGAREPR